MSLGYKNDRWENVDVNVTMLRNILISRVSHKNLFQEHAGFGVGRVFGGPQKRLVSWIILSASRMPLSLAPWTVLWCPGMVASPANNKIGATGSHEPELFINFYYVFKTTQRVPDLGFELNISFRSNF